MRLDKYLTDETGRRLSSPRKQIASGISGPMPSGPAQTSYDDSVRNLAAGGIAVSATLAAAFKDIGWTIAVAVTFLAVALFFNMLSHGTAQLDIAQRLHATRQLERAGSLGNCWTTVTTVLNVLAGVTVLGAGIAFRGLRFHHDLTGRRGDIGETAGLTPIGKLRPAPPPPKKT